ncbi:MAG: hypothetical protein C0408_11120 [Odoribacter sp.]|nr:hypothetical protein [Odoribacter sp.]
MRDQTKRRGIEGSALSGSLKDPSDLCLQPEHLSLFMEQKVSLMTQYLSITKRMKETFMLEKETDLRELLSKRQDCINKIQKIDLSFQKAIHVGTAELSRISDELKSSLDGYLHRIKSLLELIAPVDAEVMVMVKEESGSIKTELLKIRNVRHAAKGYGMKRKHMPMYLDERI